MHQILEKKLFMAFNAENLLGKMILLVVSTYVIKESLAFQETDYGSSRTVNEISDIFKFLQEKRHLISADRSKWADAFDSWIKESIGSDNKQNDIKNSITRDSIWEVWNNLPTVVREYVIKRLYSEPIPTGHSNDQGWRIHCTDAYEFCKADSNCNFKYNNFISSCSGDDLSLLADVENKSPVTAMNRHKERGKVHRKSMKRDVQEVERRRMRKERRANRKKSHAKHQESIIWMGQYFVPEKYRNTNEYNSKFFSMKTRSNKCSYKCVESLIMLNQTVYGALLAHCDCRTKQNPQTVTPATKSTRISFNWQDTNNWEETCKLHQRMAQTCRPRLYHETSNVIGCTEARLKCEKNAKCRKAQAEFLKSCSQVINGRRCTSACQDSIRELQKSTEHYNTCVCDGGDGPNCRQIRSHVVELCGIKNLPYELTDIDKQNTYHDASTLSDSEILEKRYNENIMNNSSKRFDSYDVKKRTFLNGNSSKKSFQFLNNFVFISFISTLVFVYESFIL